MEHTLELTAGERDRLAKMEDENMRLNARWAMLKREIEEIDKRLVESAVELRSFLRQSLAEHGIQDFISARLDNKAIVYTSNQTNNQTNKGSQKQGVQLREVFKDTFEKTI